MNPTMPATSQPSFNPPNAAQLAPLAICAVVAHARQGLLPPFAATLGLDYAEYQDLLQHHPAIQQAQAAIPEHEYPAIAGTSPAQFTALFYMLQENCESVDMKCQWLARAIAAAGFGSRHLWQDLGMSGRDDVSALLRTFFPALYAGNVHHYKWKKFLFAELGRRQGMPDLRPPKCSGCDQFHICFPETGISAHTASNDLHKT
ncbi:nitrogen fixation protein NifQ [Undibacterium sp.]|uniref:nitrogen fixation protein NifQ n=1 Tax=Undibacterium sp. TaxID=1914977 RepID=UPI00374DB01F